MQEFNPLSHDSGGSQSNRNIFIIEGREHGSRYGSASSTYISLDFPPVMLGR